MLLTLTGLIAVTITASVTRSSFAAKLKLAVSFAFKQELGRRAAGPAPGPLSAVSAGDFATSLTVDSDRIGSYPNAVARFAGGMVALLVLAAYLLASSVTLGLAVLLGVPLIMLLTTKIALPLERRLEEHRELLGRLGDFGADLGLGLRILRGIGGEAEFARRYRRTSDAARRAGVAVGRTQARLEAARLLLPGLFLVFVVWLGAHLALAGRIGPGDLVAFYAAAAFLIEPLNSTANFARVRATAAVAARNLDAALAVPAAHETPAASPAESEDDGQVLDGDLTEATTGLRVTAAGLTAVLVAPGVPADGLAEHLAGLRTGDHHWDVRIGGRPIDGLSRTRLRRSILFQGPSPALFSGTFRSVLDPFGSAEPEDLRRALHTAVAEDLLQRLPDGFATVLGADGRELSGGQRQRVALARSLLRAAPYLVLVEPTEALDSATEIEVVRRVRAARAGQTTVVFSRSLPWLELADRVLFLSDTPVTGTHQELLAGNADYRGLVRRDHQEIRSNV